jgi:4-diphosphocytidyl-2-C-methyl-D-erythritol kinase
MKKIEEDEIKIRTNLYYLPNNENNLAYKAAKMLKDEFNLPGGVFINLKKVNVINSHSHSHIRFRHMV